MPLMSLIYNAQVSGLPVLKYSQAYFQMSSGLVITEFLLFSPLVGLCLYLLTPWSYLAAATIILWQLVMNALVWQLEFSNSLTVLFTANATLLLSFAYLMAPSVRRVFTDKSIQWWRAQPRFATHISEILMNNSLCREAHIANISAGGALVTGNLGETKVGENLRLSFSLGRFDFTKEAEVVHKKQNSLGVRFLAKDPLLKEVIHEEKLEPERASLAGTESFKNWLADVKQGRGIFPEL